MCRDVGRRGHCAGVYLEQAGGGIVQGCRAEGALCRGVFRAGRRGALCRGVFRAGRRGGIVQCI